MKRKLENQSLIEIGCYAASGHPGLKRFRPRIAKHTIRNQQNMAQYFEHARAKKLRTN